MENVQFEEQKYTPVYVKKIAFLPSLVIRYSGGKIETENQANLILLIIALAAFLLAIIIAFTNGPVENSIPDSVIKADIERMTNQPIPKK